MSANFKCDGTRKGKDKKLGCYFRLWNNGGISNFIGLKNTVFCKKNYNSFKPTIKIVHSVTFSLGLIIGFWFLASLTTLLNFGICLVTSIYYTEIYIYERNAIITVAKRNLYNTVWFLVCQAPHNDNSLSFKLFSSVISSVSKTLTQLTLLLLLQTFFHFSLISVYIKYK